MCELALVVIFNGGFVPLELSTRGTISTVDIILRVHLTAVALCSGRKEIVRIGQREYYLSDTWPQALIYTTNEQVTMIIYIYIL